MSAKLGAEPGLPAAPVPSLAAQHPEAPAFDEKLAAAEAPQQLGGYVPDQQEIESADYNRPVFKNRWSFLKAFFWEGGTRFDGFLTVAAAQVGQVMLTLPHSMAEVGMIPGIILQLLFAGGAIWTLYLMVTLYFDFKKRSIMKGNWYSPGGKTRNRVTQYHELVYSLVGNWSGAFTLLVVIVTSVGTCLPQIVASSTNLYRITDALNKRALELIFGGTMVTLATCIPDFKNVRLFTLFALFGTSFTTWYMMATSWSEGFGGKGHVWTMAPKDNPYHIANPVKNEIASIFDGVSNILFTFGGHYMLLEVLDSTYEPGKFVKVFAAAYPYILTLTLPNSILVYWAYPEGSAKYGNSFGVFPKTGWRTTSIILMIGHQAVAFMLFIMPLQILWEKLIRTHQKPWYIRLPSRLPVSLGILFLAVAFPFYTVINGFLGAFTTSFETFIIPCAVYNWVYRTKEARNACPKAPFSNWGRFKWQITFAINWFIIVTIAVIGLGFGIYASVYNFVQSIDTFGVFAKCYECS